MMEAFVRSRPLGMGATGTVWLTVTKITARMRRSHLPPRQRQAQEEPAGGLRLRSGWPTAACSCRKSVQRRLGICVPSRCASGELAGGSRSSTAPIIADPETSRSRYEAMLPAA